MSSETGIPLATTSIIIGSLVGFAALLTIIWNFSKKITTMELSIAAQEKKHLEDIKSIELKQEQAKTERRDEIRDSLENQTGKFAAIQSQVDSIKSDVKDISSRVTQNDQKAKHAEEAIREIKDSIKDQRDFITKWNQRVEDRIRDIVKFLMGFNKGLSNNGEE